MAWHIRPHHSVPKEVQHRMLTHLERASQRVADTDQPPAARVHALRKSCKKVRAVLKLLRAEDAKTYRRENAWLRDTGRKLSAARDADVQLGTLRELKRTLGSAAPREAIDAARRYLLARRRQTRLRGERLERRLGQAAERLAEAQDRLATLRWSGAGFEAVLRGFAASYRRARCAAAEIAAQPEADGEVYHEWRKAVKVHEHQLRLLECAWPAVMKAWQGEVSALASCLGQEHDLSFLRTQLLDAPVAGEEAERVQVVIALIEARRDVLRAEARRIARPLFAEKPGAVAARVRAWWCSAEVDSAESQVPLASSDRG